MHAEGVGWRGPGRNGLVPVDGVVWPRGVVGEWERCVASVR